MNKQISGFSYFYIPEALKPFMDEQKLKTIEEFNTNSSEIYGKLDEELSQGNLEKYIENCYGAFNIIINTLLRAAADKIESPETREDVKEYIKEYKIKIGLIISSCSYILNA